MLIVYEQDIRYDPERTDDAEREQLVSNIAKSLSSEKGEIALIEPSNTNIIYDVQSGEADLKSKIGNVNNSFSSEDKIKELVLDAISLKAKITLLEKLAGLDNTIAKRIHDNHGNLQNNLTRSLVDKTLGQIQNLGMTGIKFSYGSENKTPIQRQVSHALAIFDIKKIKSMDNVKTVLDIIGSPVQSNVKTNRAGG